jgi:hypothetical protein
MLGTFIKIIGVIFKNTYKKSKPYLVYIFMITLIIAFYFINKKTFNEMYKNIINNFSNKKGKETFINKNMAPRILTNKKPIRNKRVKFNNIGKQKIFDYKEPPHVVSETNEIEGMYNSNSWLVESETNKIEGMDNSNSWLVESKKKMINEESFVPDMMFPKNSNELIKVKKNIESNQRELKDIFSDMLGDVESDVTDEQRRLIQGNDYKDYNTSVVAPENLFTQYDQPHFNNQYNVGIKAFEGNSFGSLL